MARVGPLDACHEHRAVTATQEMVASQCRRRSSKEQDSHAEAGACMCSRSLRKHSHFAQHVRLCFIRERSLSNDDALTSEDYPSLAFLGLFCLFSVT